MQQVSQYILNASKIAFLDRSVLFVVGYPCSGKDFFAELYFEERDIIRVSDIVKELSNTTKTSKLNQTKDLSKDIAERLILQITNSLESDNRVVVVGLRQLVVLRLILNAQRLHLSIKQFAFVHLSTDRDVAKQRYANRRRSTDDISYEEVVRANDNLGLSTLISFVEKHLNYVKIESYEGR